MLRQALRAGLAAALLLGATTAGAGAAAPPAPGTAVVAVLDTGINPYHPVFRDRSPRAYRHPSTYLPGFPKSAVALRVTLDAKDYAKAVRRDCRLWETVRPGQLYWVPGTKIAGAISFSSQTGGSGCRDGGSPAAPIIESAGHGTMTASRAVGTGYGACPACRVVAVQFAAQLTAADAAVAAVRWTAANAGWIDAQSNSWGPMLPAWGPAAGGQLVTSTPQLVRAVEAGGRAHLSFWASGNGAANRGGFVGHHTLLEPRLTPSVLSVGGHDSGTATTWHGFPPHVVADACGAKAAAGDWEEEWDDSGGGTSTATPFAAGGAAAILAEARRLLRDPRTGVRGGVVASGRRGLVARGPLADGALTLAEWRDVVLKTATRRPAAQREDGQRCGVKETGGSPVEWRQVPDAFPEHLSIGYGAVDRPSIALAAAVLRGAKPLPDRATTDAYFAADRSAREAAYAVFSTG